MDGGDAGGSGVEIAILRPATVLRGPVDELDLGAVAHCPVAAAGTAPRFKDGAFEARLAQFVGRHQPGDTAAQDDHALALSEVRGERGEGRRTRHRGKSKNLHGPKRSGVTADLGDPLQEYTSSEAH